MMQTTDRQKGANNIFKDKSVSSESYQKCKFKWSRFE